MPDDPIIEALADLLQRAPERWQALDRDALSAIEERALGLLAAAGFIEVRVGLEITMAGHAQGLRLTLETTGETGLAQALAPVLSDLLVRWESALAEAKRQGIADPVTLHPVGSTAWRLAEQGLRARADLASDDEDVRGGMFSFLLRRPAFASNGQPVLVPVEPDQRPPELANLPLVQIDGRTSIRDRTWTLVGAVPAQPEGPFPVQVQNWDGGAEAIAAALAKLIPSAQPKPTGKKRYGEDPARWTGKAKLALLRNLLANTKPRSRAQIAEEASKADAGDPASVERSLVVLAKAGWLKENKDGTCLSIEGIRGSVRQVGEPA